MVSLRVRKTEENKKIRRFNSKRILLTAALAVFSFISPFYSLGPEYQIGQVGVSPKIIGWTGAGVVTVAIGVGVWAAGQDPPPASGQTCSSVTYNSPSGNNIVFTFDRTYQCGQFANGDWFVSPDSPGGSVNLVSVTPSMTGSGSSFRHGIVSNISQTTGNAQSFDGRVPSFTPPSISFPYSAEGGESLLKLVSSTSDLCVGGSPDNCGQFAAVLTVLDTPPANPSNTFRPPYAWSYKPLFTVDQLQTQFLLNLDSTLITTGTGAVPKPTRNDILARVLHQRYATYPSSVAVLEAEDAFAPDGDSWGGDVLKKDAEIVNWLMLDDACTTPPCTAQQELAAKLPILIGYVQYGIDMWGAFKGGTDMLEGGGGNGAGKMFIAAFAATMLNNTEMKNDLQGTSERLWWETYSIYRSSKTGMALWGQMPNANWTFSQWQQNWWNDFPSCTNCNLRDPYGYIDGGSIPGTSYMRSTMMPAKYLGLISYMIPQLTQAYPNNWYSVITEYADRVVQRGAHTIPDPCRTEVGVYGVDHGPNATNTDCIFNPADDPNDDQGRVPTQHGDTTDGEGASRHSAFNDRFWSIFRDDFGTSPPPPSGGETIVLNDARFVCDQNLSNYGELPLTLEMTAANASAAAQEQQGLVDIRSGCNATGHDGIDLILHIYGNGSTVGPGWDAVVTRKGSFDLDVTGFADCGSIAPGAHQDGLDIRGGINLNFIDFRIGNWNAQTHTCHGAGGMFYPGGFQLSDEPDRRLDQVIDVLCIRCVMVARNQSLRIENSTDTGAINSCFAGDIPLAFGENHPTDPNEQRAPLRPINENNLFIDRNSGSPQPLPSDCPVA